MSKPSLTKEIAYEALQNFFIKNKPFVLFATGTSCAVDTDFGMPALEGYLKSEIPRRALSSEQENEWTTVLDMLSNNPDFEAAMNSIKDDALLKIVIDKAYSTRC